MRSILVMLVAALMAAPLYAGRLRTNLWGGYGFIGMAAVNQNLDATQANVQSTLRTTFGDQALRVTVDDKFQAATLCGWDLGYRVTDEVTIGTRIAQLTGNRGKIRSVYAGGGSTVDLSITQDCALTPLLVGFDYTTGINEKWDISGAMYLGYGFASATYKATVNATGARAAATSFSVPLEGGTMVANFQGTFLRQLTDQLYLGIHANYLAAKVAKMTVTKDVTDATTGLSYRKNSADTDATGKDLAYDFSSGTFGLSLNYYF